jgi:hypothetical protein
MAGGTGEPKPASVPVDQWTPISKEMNEARVRLRDQAYDLERAIRSELTDQVDDLELDPPTGPAVLPV